MWYKGLDLMLQVFSELVQSGDDLYFDVAGEWDQGYLNTFIASEEVRRRVRFVGKVKEPYSFFEGAVLYLHTARGEAWGLTVTEAMAAGVVPIVSEWTGSKECVARVSPKLVVELDQSAIVDRVKWFFGLGHHEKEALAAKCKEVANSYTEEKAVTKFNEIFTEALFKIS
jgi:glycosyltransferase involved in cell wall biosynthesis